MPLSRSVGAADSSAYRDPTLTQSLDHRPLEPTSHPLQRLDAQQRLQIRQRMGATQIDLDQRRQTDQGLEIELRARPDADRLQTRARLDPRERPEVGLVLVLGEIDDHTADLLDARQQIDVLAEQRDQCVGGLGLIVLDPITPTLALVVEIVVVLRREIWDADRRAHQTLIDERLQDAQRQIGALERSLARRRWLLLR